MEEIPANRNHTGRNPDGTFMPGVSGNPSGRPKGTLKDYVRRYFQEMDDERKREWLVKNNINPIDIWRMGEGNPKEVTDINTNPIAEDLTLEEIELAKKLIDDRRRSQANGPESERGISEPLGGEVSN